jgi:hypothetical protein
MLQPRRTLVEVPLKPPQCCPFVLRRPTLGIEVNELEGVFGGVRQLAGGILRHPKGSPLDRTAETKVRITQARARRPRPRQLPSCRRGLQAPEDRGAS